MLQSILERHEDSYKDICRMRRTLYWIVDVVTYLSDTSPRQLYMKLTEANRLDPMGMICQESC